MIEQAEARSKRLFVCPTFLLIYATEQKVLSPNKTCYLCASLFQPGRPTASRDLVRCSQRAWLGERGADRGRSQRRTTHPAGRPSWELGAPPASRSLTQAYLAGLSGHSTRGGERVSTEDKSFKESFFSELTLVFFPW